MLGNPRVSESDVGAKGVNQPRNATASFHELLSLSVGQRSEIRNLLSHRSAGSFALVHIFRTPWYNTMEALHKDGDAKKPEAPKDDKAKEDSSKEKDTKEEPTFLSLMKL